MTKTYTTDELKAINEDDFRYASLWLIETNFDLESGTDDKDHPLYGIPFKDFYRSQEDVIETWVGQLDELEVDYSTELSNAEKLLTEIVNLFVEKWDNTYTLEQCIEDVPSNCGVFYLMAGSALGSGIGLWEEIGSGLGSFPKFASSDGIDCSYIQTKVAQCYEWEEEDDRE
ncbi:hypothetical protein [Chroococcidiopsis sp.]|uniref:hypothetical protein n=1 Tax=Chroococcidiopsis sp. TaxID=3088168 RepID=UPI003F319191